jgi:hypothetical protein
MDDQPGLPEVIPFAVAAGHLGCSARTLDASETEASCARVSSRAAAAGSSKGKLARPDRRERNPTVAHFIDRPLLQGEASSAPWRAMQDPSW